MTAKSIDYYDSMSSPWTYLGRKFAAQYATVSP